MSTLRPETREGEEDFRNLFRGLLERHLAGAGSGPLAGAINAFTRDKLRYIEHIPLKYFLPEAPSEALPRLDRELAEHGRIEIHPRAWVPRCLVDEGIELLPYRESVR